MNKDNLSSLYNALISKGYSTEDLGDEKTFRSKMSDKGNRKALYDYVSGRGDFRIGNYEAMKTGCRLLLPVLLLPLRMTRRVPYPVRLLTNTTKASLPVEVTLQQGCCS